MPHIQVHTGKKGMPFRELPAALSPSSLERAGEKPRATETGWPRTLGTAVKCLGFVLSYTY